MKTNIKYIYKIVSDIGTLINCLTTRQAAREALKSYKDEGLTSAKIIREKYMLIYSENIR